MLQKAKKRLFCILFISGLSELFGAVITSLFLKPFINDVTMGCLFFSYSWYYDKYIYI